VVFNLDTIHNSVEEASEEIRPSERAPRVGVFVVFLKDVGHMAYS